MAGGGFNRLLGLGFVFGAKDAGATRTVEGLADGMDRVSDSAKESARSAQSWGQSLSNAIAGASLAQLSKISDKLGGLAEQAGVASETLGVETFGVEFSNTWRRATVGLGPLRDQVEGMRGQISSLAYSLDVDANEMINTVTGLARAGHRLEDFGLSARSMAGALQASVLSGQELSDLLTGLSRGYDLGGEGAGRLADRVTALGERFGVGAEAIKRLPAIISAADPVLARFGDISIEEVTESITRLSTAMVAGVGGSFEAASEAAVELFTKLSDTRSEVANLVTGIGGDFPELATELGIVTGDIDASMQSILSDPLQFARNMRAVGEGLDRGSPKWDRFSKLMAEMGPAFAFLITDVTAAPQALEAAAAPIDNFGGALNKMLSSGTGTSRTFAESMDRMKENFERNLRSMGSVTRREVLVRQREAFGRIEDTLRDFSKRDGPLGLLTQAFLNVRNHGIVHGLLPMLEDRLAKSFPSLSEKIRTMVPFLGDLGSGAVEAASSMAPLLIILSQMGILGHVKTVLGGIGKAIKGVMVALGPIGLIAVAVAAVVYYWDDIREFFENTDWSGMMDKVSGAFDAGLTAVLDWFDGIDWAALVGRAYDAFSRALVGAWNLSEKIGEWISSVNWVAVGQKIADGFRAAWEFLTNLFSGGGEFSDKTRQFFEDALGFPPEQIIDQVLLAVRSILENTVGKMPELIHDVLTGIFGEDSAWVTIFDTIFKAGPLGFWQRILNADSIWDVIFGGDLSSETESALDGVLGLVVSYFEGMIDLWAAIGEAAYEIWDEMIVPMGEIAWEVFGMVGEALSQVWDGIIKPILQSLGLWWNDEFTDGAIPDAQKSLESLGDKFRKMWRETIKPALFDFLKTATAIITEFYQKYFNTFRAIARFAVHRIFDIVLAFATLESRFNSTRDILSRGWELIGVKIRRFFTEPIIRAKDTWSSMTETITLGFREVEVAVLGMIASVLRSFEQFAQGLGRFGAGIATRIGSALRGEDGQEGLEGVLRAKQDSLAELHRKTAKERRERAAEAIRSELEDAESAAQFAIAITQAVATEQNIRRSVQETRDAVLGGIDTVQNVFGGIVRNANERVQQMEEERIREALAEQVQSEQPVETLMSSEAESQAVQEETTVARTRRRRPSAPVRSTETESGGDESRRATARRRDTAAAATTAERTETARATAREMIISAFGPDAVRQLNSAMGGGGQTRRRAAGTAPGGDPVGAL